jgi:hypothetical protein
MVLKIRFPYAAAASAPIMVACHVPAQATLLDAAVWFERPVREGVTFLKANGTVIHTFDNGSQHNVQQGIVFNDRTDVTINRPTQPWINEAPSYDYANRRHP